MHLFAPHYFACKASDLVVVIQQPQSCHTVLISIDAHHGLGGGDQRVFQVVLPRLILAAEHSAGGHRHFIWHHHHQPFAVEAMGKWEETESVGCQIKVNLSTQDNSLWSQQHCLRLFLTRLLSVRVNKIHFRWAKNTNYECKSYFCHTHNTQKITIKHLHLRICYHLESETVVATNTSSSMFMLRLNTAVPHIKPGSSCA